MGTVIGYRVFCREPSTGNPRNIRTKTLTEAREWAKTFRGLHATEVTLYRCFAVGDDRKVE
jgi:hypothetical protein